MLSTCISTNIYYRLFIGTVLFTGDTIRSDFFLLGGKNIGEQARKLERFAGLLNKTVILTGPLMQHFLLTDTVD